MNVSLNWLNDHLDLSHMSLQEIDDLLTFAGVEVEGIESKGVPSDKIVVAQVKSAEQHPDADKLKVCMVDAGEGELRQIVCGAKNYKVGDKVPCALPGADLGGGFVIKEGKLRGVPSLGMLCAAGEIGLIDAEDGLMILQEDAVIGEKLQDMFDADTIIEVEVTPNRPDLLSHTGMARELGALAGIDRKSPALETPETTGAAGLIQLNATDSCPYYTAVKISGVKVTESPEWLKTKLEAIGLRPINNVVDITNYALHELGHPLHAFDAAKVKGALDIRMAADGETFKALDEVDYKLAADDVVISDASGKALALGGIMGGLDSGVTETTTDVILESAYFTPSNIRRSSRRLALSSDSSYRFERGSDPQAVLTSSAFVAKLITELAGGSIEGATAVAGEAPVLTSEVELDAAKLDQLMGGSISLADAEDILTRLGLDKVADNKWQVPSYRLDLPRHIDLVEEVARVHGLDKVPSRYTGTFVQESAVDAAYDYQMAQRKTLAALGFYETQTIKLIAESSTEATVPQMDTALPLRPLMDGDVIRVALPLSEDHAIMRPSLTPGLVATAARNIRQGVKSLRFFEIGRQFRNAGGGKAKDLEADSLALLMGGDASPSGWSADSKSIDAFDLKAVIESLLPNKDIQFTPRKRDGFILAADIQCDGKPIGAFAQLSPAKCRELGSNTPIYLAELELKKCQQLGAGTSQADELPQFPGSSRDAAMEAPVDMPNADIEKAIKKHNEMLLVSSACFDLFTDPTGEKLPADKKSIAYTFHYRSPERTLKAKEVDDAHQKLLAHLTKTLPITFR
ncbi:phenylalanine--tRNA ligase subunit beta [Verrucomicrobiaceae bacterium 5K15]|uniref:Phenylalanine--tRNA ligase beta subunit n=1 Tax=Oceaniferula flava TaxID=2800421 RepID=A0AAE2SEM9_9BACT|nr:phenylalanine--tRNA ligase subunit beta [Oceaniferula flavus]MBK1855587.1 phenylalanine--tRNA ligase subunit beta [Oceaniferula flavus]MBM1136893.1 phenylalanine--tRNA ligase subunit beta [Oceaniferula flavus]